MNSLFESMLSNSHSIKLSLKFCLHMFRKSAHKSTQKREKHKQMKIHPFQSSVIILFISHTYTNHNNKIDDSEVIVRACLEAFSEDIYAIGKKIETTNNYRSTQ